jgi:hypothetical protein
MNFYGQRYHLGAVVGDAETGKTTYMVRRLIKELDSGNYDQGFCNINIRHPKIQKITFRELISLKLPAPDGVPRALVGLDQLHKYFDARRSNSILNVKSTEVLIESRQHGFDVIGTTWARSAIDPRYRKFTAMFISSERIRTGFRYEFWDRDSGLKDVKTMTFEQASLEAWPFFDTSELIEDPTIEEWVRENRGSRKAALAVN